MFYKDNCVEFTYAPNGSRVKNYLLILISVMLLSSCNLDDWWVIYRLKPHHGFYIENNSGREIYHSAGLVGTPKSEYSYFDDVFCDGSTDEWLYRTIQIRKGKRILRILNENTTLFIGTFPIRIEDVVPRDDGIVCIMVICYIDDLYPVYNGETDEVTYYEYFYTLEDLQRYDWKVPFPDESGTIKVNMCKYTIKENTSLGYDDLHGK